MIKHKMFRRAHVTLERLPSSGMYLVELWSDAAGLLDRVRCDDYRMAMEYFGAFQRIAKNH